MGPKELKVLYETNCITAKGAILMAAKQGICGYRAIADHLGISETGYYRALRQLGEDGLMKVSSTAASQFSRETKDGPVIVEKVRRYTVSIGKI